MTLLATAAPGQSVWVWLSFAAAAFTVAARSVNLRRARGRAHMAIQIASIAIATVYCIAYLVLIFGPWSQPEWANVTRKFAPALWLILGVLPPILAPSVLGEVERSTVAKVAAVLEGEHDA
jgi:hypothetical protein